MGEGEGEPPRSANRRSLARPPGVLRRASWGDWGGHSGLADSWSMEFCMAAGYSLCDIETLTSIFLAMLLPCVSHWRGECFAIVFSPWQG